MSVPMPETILDLIEDARDEYKSVTDRALRTKQDERQYVAEFVHTALLADEEMEYADRALLVLDASAEANEEEPITINEKAYVPLYVAVEAIADLLRS